MLIEFEDAGRLRELEEAIKRGWILVPQEVGEEVAWGAKREKPLKDWWESHQHQVSVSFANNPQVEAFQDTLMNDYGKRSWPCPHNKHKGLNHRKLEFPDICCATIGWLCKCTVVTTDQSLVCVCKIKGIRVLNLLGHGNLFSGPVEYFLSLLRSLRS
jgi:hypothetical protein